MARIEYQKTKEQNLPAVTPNSRNFENDHKGMAENKLDPTTWVDAYADYLFNYAIARINDAEIAKDLVQETFLAGLKSAKNYKGDAAERTWLIAILKRKVIDYYRKSNSKKGKAEVRINYGSQTDAEGDWLEEQVADPFSNFEHSDIENEELGLAIQSCIEKLPKKQAQVFTMKTIQGISTEDICNELNINPSNLWVMIHRARTALMGCLNQSWF
ncbi:RNA polymerase sigma-70 factor, ECF subfamily [Pseudozobellia thermophila]|uniref:RNA polymerase sigma-70 factor, ECF subfamily n=2 Tax=Pseudozobellia thermophila TaxID=192903 RepID=A0A1M6LSF9_9FLAO|nr:RNA polymerase sigma-70 factor, ECF subfamily [Pseudozobellia thermophila]